MTDHEWTRQVPEHRGEEDRPQVLGRPYLSVRQTAEYLGLSVTSTYEQLRSGVLRRVSSRVGRRILVNREALDELLKGGEL